MQELEADTRSYLDDREQAELERISKTYDGQIHQLEDAERTQRTLAIERFEEFLARYPNLPYASHVRFRLADLYWEKASEEILDAQHAYEAEADRLQAEGRGDEIGAAPKMDLTRPMELYVKIIEDNENLPRDQQYEYLDGALYSLGFVYAEDRGTAYDEEKAKEQFHKLLRVRPDSEYVDDAHLALGNFAFQALPPDLTLAVSEYRKIIDKGPSSKLYEDAMYQLAWAYYKNSRYDHPVPGDPPTATALGQFTALLDYSEAKYAQSGRRSDYSPDATKFMAFSFADVAELSGRDPTEVASSYFAAIGPRAYEHEVYVRLGEALTDYGRFQQAIGVYTKLQTDERWKYDPENPEYQMKIARLYVSLNDLPAQGAARIALTEKYNDESQWWAENRHNPDALSAARAYIEGSLEDVAIEYRLNADKDQQPASYALAAEKFQEYLDKFPMSDDYYKMQAYLAETYYLGAKFEEAATQYDSLVRSRKHHPYGDIAVFQLMRSREKLVGLKHGPFDALPPDAVVERTYTTPSQTVVTVYALSPEHTKYIAAADQVLTHHFTKPDDPTAQDIGAVVDENRGAIMYLPAQVLFWHNRYDEARPRLLAIINQNKCAPEASFAAKMVVASYQAEVDNNQVLAYSRRFKAELSSCGDIADANDFGNLEEQTAFKMAIALSEANKNDEAAQAFLDFIKEYPTSDKNNLALYNAATNYDRLGRAEKANQLYEQYVNTYPKDERSASLYYRIAYNYESTLDLDKAIDYYNRLLRNFPADQNAAAAKYNQAFLKIGIGDHLGAAKGFEEYAAQFPNESDAADSEFKAGEEYERVGATQAIAFYDRYRKKYGVSDPDHALECDYKAGQLYAKQGNTRKYNEYLDKTMADYDAIISEGRSDKIGADGRHFAAEAGFRSLQADYDQLIKDKLGTNDQKNAELLKRKEAEVGNFRTTANAFVNHYPDFEYLTAARYMAAKAILYHTELGYAALVCPPNLTDEEFEICSNLIEELRGQFDAEVEKATTELNQLIKDAEDAKRHSVWIDKAHETLNDIDPLAYPAVKQELHGSSDATITPTVRPMRASEAEQK
jgi:TolA-binding protein